MDADTQMMDFSDGATGSFDEEEPEQKFQLDTIINPIVYTTKLDEMEIFRGDTGDMSVNTIINSMIKESKPTLNLKRKCTHTIYSHYSYEDLSYYINTFNRKVARIAEHNNNLLSMCKPVKVVLEDIKYTLHLSRTERRNSIIYKQMFPYVRAKPLSSYSQSRKRQSRIIYDLQRKEADMYTRDKYYNIKEYFKFRIDEGNANIFRSLKMDKNVSHISCCCWYDREESLALLPNTSNETRENIRFMRKPHKCAVNLCRCCCRNKPVASPVKPSSLEPLESHSIWLNRMRKVHASLQLSDKSRKTLLSKVMSAHPILEKQYSHMNPVVEIQDTIPFLHSTNIDFKDEFYAIGADGQIKLYFKKNGKDRRKLANVRLKTANNIMAGNICCWHKREEFAGRLLLLGALPNTVNYIRSAHPWSTTNCSCCCKPSNTGKPKLTILDKYARHTNDLVNKKVNIKVRFSRDLEKPVTPKNLSNFASFNVSLSALEVISKGKTEPLNNDVFDLLIQENATLDNKSSVRVLVEKTQKPKTVIECTNLNSFTTKELKMLDIIFCAVNKTVKQPKDEIKPRISRVWKKYFSCSNQTIYPLSLNTQLSISADLRSKRLLPSLRAHLDKYILSFNQVRNISGWLATEESLDSSNTKSAESKANENVTVIVYKRKKRSPQDRTV